MNKEQAINFLIKKIYDYKEHLVVSKKDIKKVEDYYKNNSTRFNSIDDFLASDENIKNIVDKLKSGKQEIEKQLTKQKALQPGILAECVFMQTLAKILELRSFIDLEETSFAKVPIEISPYVKDSAGTICSARYVYYNKKDSNTLIIQYGNPKAGDATAIVYTHEIVIEIKDMPALLMDTDLIYDEEGKFIIPSDMNPAYAKYINNFNETTSVFEKLGTNYKLLDNNETDRKDLLKQFFNSSDIDVIITTVGKKDDLIGIKTSDIDYVFPDGNPLICTSGSEIRTTGKNARTGAFTPIYLEKVLTDNDVAVSEDNICRIYKNNDKILGKVHGRGKDKNTFTRLKINNAFFVRISDITESDKCYEFPKNKINQSKSGISLHIEIKKTKKEIKENLYKNINNKQESKNNL